MLFKMTSAFMVFIDMVSTYHNHIGKKWKKKPAFAVFRVFDKGLVHEHPIMLRPRNPLELDVSCLTPLSETLSALIELKRYFDTLWS